MLWTLPSKQVGCRKFDSCQQSSCGQSDIQLNTHPLLFEVTDDERPLLLPNIWQCACRSNTRRCRARCFTKLWYGASFETSLEWTSFDLPHLGYKAQVRFSWTGNKQCVFQEYSIGHSYFKAEYICKKYPLMNTKPVNTGIIFMLSYSNVYWFFAKISAWAFNQIRKIASCACTGNAGNVFPATDFKGSR